MAQRVYNYISDNPRPVNSTKIYGSDDDPRLSSEHAVHTFFRNIIGGFASSRFHRPPAGLGLNDTTFNIIQSLRMVETKMKFWDLIPHMDLLADCEKNEAYLAAQEGKNYLVYFPKKGSVNLDLRKQEGTFTVLPIDIKNAEWGESYIIEGDGMAGITSDNESGALVLISKN